MAVDFDKLQFDECSENVAVQDVLTFADGLRDNRRKQILVDLAFGWEKPEGVPTVDDVPMLRVWCDSGTDRVDNNCNVSTEGRRLLSLFFYFYAFAEDEGENIQAQRARFIKHFIKKLSHPDTLAAFHAENWRIDFDTDFEIDHTQALKRIADYITVEPPWYVTRVDIWIEVFTQYDDGD